MAVERPSARAGRDAVFFELEFFGSLTRDPSRAGPSAPGVEGGGFLLSLRGRSGPTGPRLRRHRQESPRGAGTGLRVPAPEPVVANRGDQVPTPLRRSPRLSVRSASARVIEGARGTRSVAAPGPTRRDPRLPGPAALRGRGPFPRGCSAKNREPLSGPFRAAAARALRSDRRGEAGARVLRPRRRARAIGPVRGAGGGRRERGATGAP